MPAVELLADRLTHTQRLLQSLVAAGWQLSELPPNNSLPRNRAKLTLRTPNQTKRLRLSIYKIGKSGRSRPDERRVEITTTYISGLERTPEFADVVLGFEPDLNVYVGLDPRRLEFGGETSNASTFVDRTCVDTAEDERITVRAYPAHILGGTEFQAYFRPSRLSEYLFNHEVIHANFYIGHGEFSGPIDLQDRPLLLQSPRESQRSDMIGAESAARKSAGYSPPQTVILAYEKNDIEKLRRAGLNPDQFQAIKRICEENGLLGEQYVLDSERKRLRRLGRPDLAEMVEWSSQVSVNLGYDIHSFEEDGRDRLIEVKSTSGRSRSFEISSNEWDTAIAYGEGYHIYRVFEVRSSRPNHEILSDPCSLERAGKISRTPNGFRIRMPPR